MTEAERRARGLAPLLQLRQIRLQAAQRTLQRALQAGQRAQAAVAAQEAQRQACQSAALAAHQALAQPGQQLGMVALQCRLATLAAAQQAVLHSEVPLRRARILQQRAVEAGAQARQGLRQCELRAQALGQQAQAAQAALRCEQAARQEERAQDERQASRWSTE